jgi:hypothetical protein
VSATLAVFLKELEPALNIADVSGGRARTRTGTPVSQVQILSLLCLPFHHAA